MNRGFAGDGRGAMLGQGDLRDGIITLFATLNILNEVSQRHARPAFNVDPRRVSFSDGISCRIVKRAPIAAPRRRK